MDPLLEHLHHEKQQRVSEAPVVRERISEGIAALGLAVVVALLWVFTSPGAPASPVTVVALVVLYALVWQVTFEVGAGTTTPLQLVFIPMWFAVDPAQLPLVVAAGQMLGNALSSARAREEQNWGRVLIGFPDAWYAVGPAVVLAAFGTGAPDLADWPVYLLALGAQAFFDAGTAVVREWAASSRRPGLQLRLGIWITAVDLALAPVGLLAAIAMLDTPWALVAVIPIVGLLGQFAKERDNRISKAVELSHAYRGTAQLMGDVLEADDAYTGGEHTHGVVELSLAVGKALGLGPAAMRDLEFGALLHDIGKLRVPNAIINKPGKLTDAEWLVIKQHPAFGQEMLDRVGGVLSDAGRIVRAHHERYGGGGYPDGLVGEEIPIEARIITVCDSFSAMTTDRSYRRGMTRAAALTELRACTPSQFDPRVVDALLDALLDRPAYGRSAEGAEAPPAAPAPISTLGPLKAVPNAPDLTAAHAARRPAVRSA